MNNIVSIINKKSKGLSLSKDEINFFVNGYMNEKIKDYQASSLLMAIKINGLNNDELLSYSEALINSGECFKLNNNLVDKHSTGGIGDKTSIALLPILASMGIKVFKISGRGLGFTGGTIDKLESVKGFNVELDMNLFNKMLKKINLSLTSQTSKLVPADKKIYALRDITGTTDSLELIAASIMSKKIVSGAKNIIIDIKIGTGAFIKNIKEGKNLAILMKKIANHFNRNLFILFSNMNQPLGTSIGNKNEIIEVIDALENNNWSPDFYELIKKISIELYVKLKNTSFENANNKFKKVIENGKSFKRLKRWFKEFGVINFNESTKFEPKEKMVVNSDESGFISFGNIEQIGNSLIKIGVGRKNKNDKLDFNSGIKLFVKTGDKIKKGDKLFEITSSNKIPLDVINKIKKEFLITRNKRKINLILGELSW